MVHPEIERYTRSVSVCFLSLDARKKEFNWICSSCSPLRCCKTGQLCALHRWWNYTNSEKLGSFVFVKPFVFIRHSDSHRNMPVLASYSVFKLDVIMLQYVLSYVKSNIFIITVFNISCYCSFSMLIFWRHSNCVNMGKCRISLTDVEVDKAGEGNPKIDVLLLHYSWKEVNITDTLYLTRLVYATRFYL